MSESFIVEGIKDSYTVYNKVLGKGAYGVVLYAKAVTTGKELAAKIISKKSLSQMDIMNLRNEIQNQTLLDHPNVVQMVEAFEDQEYLYMILEYCEGGCLFTKIQLQGAFKEDKAFKYFIQIVRGLHYLHNRGMLHRDIKLSNILITNNDQIKLADFTWSIQTYMGYVQPQICGTLDYMPPEVMNRGFQNEKLDIWSLGMALYEMLHNDIPRQNIQFKFGLSEECKKLITSMLEVEVHKRPTTLEILQGSWVKNQERQLLKIIVQKSKTSSPETQQIGSPFGSPLSSMGSPLRTVSFTSIGSNGNQKCNFPLRMSTQALKKYTKQINGIAKINNLGKNTEIK